MSKTESAPKGDAQSAGADDPVVGTERVTARVDTLLLRKAELAVEGDIVPTVSAALRAALREWDPDDIPTLTVGDLPPATRVWFNGRRGQNPRNKAHLKRKCRHLDRVDDEQVVNAEAADVLADRPVCRRCANLTDDEGANGHDGLWNDLDDLDPDAVLGGVSDAE